MARAPSACGPILHTKPWPFLDGMEDYLDYRWLPTSVQHHYPKGLIVAHFWRLGLTTSYRHETLPDDSLFKDVKRFEGAIVRMWLRHIPEEQIVFLGQDPKVDQLEWQRQCFVTQ